MAGKKVKIAKKVKLAHNSCESASKATFKKLKKELIEDARTHCILDGVRVCIILRDPLKSGKEFLISIDPEGNVQEIVRKIET